MEATEGIKVFVLKKKKKLKKFKISLAWSGNIQRGSSYFTFYKVFSLKDILSLDHESTNR